MTGAAILAAALLPAATATSQEAAAADCRQHIRYEVVSSAPSYEAIGGAAGKYNASSVPETLHYDQATTASKKTTWRPALGGSPGWAVGLVEDRTGFGVTETARSGLPVSHTVRVPGRSYGYIAPKIERRTFTVERWQGTPACGTRYVGVMGTLSAVTAYPVLSACVARSPCTLRP